MQNRLIISSLHPVWVPCKQLTTVSCLANEIDRAFKNTLTISQRFFQQGMLLGFVRDMYVRDIKFLLNGLSQFHVWSMRSTELLKTLLLFLGDSYSKELIQGFVKEMHVRYICYLLDRVYVEMHVKLS